MNAFVLFNKVEVLASELNFRAHTEIDISEYIFVNIIILGQYPPRHKSGSSNRCSWAPTIMPFVRPLYTSSFHLSGTLNKRPRLCLAKTSHVHPPHWHWDLPKLSRSDIGTNSDLTTKIVSVYLQSCLPC